MGASQGEAVEGKRSGWIRVDFGLARCGGLRAPFSGGT